MVDENAKFEESENVARSILPLKAEALRYTAGGQTLIKDVSFELSAAGRSIILGANGAGKSLLLRLLHGLIIPTSGTVRWASPEAQEVRQRQAMVFQRPVMLRRSAAANVDYALKLRHVPRAERRLRIEDALRRTRLWRHRQRPARILSIGEQQRLALARVWAINPDILFLDEPTASLDPSVTRHIEELIYAIEARGTKIVMTTHDLHQARRLADEILFLHRGRLLERAAAETLFEQAKTKEAQAFIRGELM